MSCCPGPFGGSRSGVPIPTLASSGSIPPARNGARSARDVDGRRPPGPVEDGRVTATHLGDYKVPSIADVPAFQQAFLDSVEGPAPYGSKAVGEVNICGMAPAIANAVYDAVGVRITDLPLTAEKVYEALHTSSRRGAVPSDP